MIYNYAGVRKKILIIIDLNLDPNVPNSIGKFEIKPEETTLLVDTRFVILNKLTKNLTNFVLSELKFNAMKNGTIKFWVGNFFKYIIDKII